MFTANEKWAARAAEASAHAKATADAITGEEEEENTVIQAPLLRDAYNRILTEVPRGEGLSAGHYLPKTPGFKVIPVSLTGGTPGHGEGGIDGKPVPQDTWGIRGALKGMAGMPKPIPAEKFKVQKHHEGIGKQLLPEDMTPFPGLTGGGHVERTAFRRQAEALPHQRAAPETEERPLTSRRRAHETRDWIARTSVSAQASYWDKDKRNNAVSIRLLEQARAEYNAKKAREAQRSAEKGKRVQWEERESERGTVPDVMGPGGASGPGPGGVPVKWGRKGEMAAEAAHYEQQGVGVLLREGHVAARPAGLVNRHAGTERRERVELVPPEEETRPARRVLVARVLGGTAAGKALAPSISAGDELLRVDGADVTCLPLPIVNALILGRPGSHVILLFRRSLSAASKVQTAALRSYASEGGAALRGGEEAILSDSSDSSDVHPDDDLHHMYQVKLVRGSAEYIALLESTQRLLDSYSESQSRLEEMTRSKEADVGQVLQLQEALRGASLLGELAYGARVRALEQSVETLNASNRQQQRDLERGRAERGGLEQQLAAALSTQENFKLTCISLPGFKFFG